MQPLNCLKILPLILLSSCSTPKIQTVTEFIKPVITQQKHPKPILLSKVEWRVVSDKNLEQYLAESRKINGQVVFVSLSVRGYESLSLNVQEMKRYIDQQKAIILYYEKSTSRK
tara:strand:+ start:889 stop:1230 length:342 start_codon:yes stop_codon:yes gene_type:complete